MKGEHAGRHAPLCIMGPLSGGTDFLFPQIPGFPVPCLQPAEKGRCYCPAGKTQGQLPADLEIPYFPQPVLQNNQIPCFRGRLRKSLQHVPDFFDPDPQPVQRLASMAKSIRARQAPAGQL